MLDYNNLQLDWLSWSYDPDDYLISKIDHFWSVFPELKVIGMFSKQVYSHYEKAFYLANDIMVYYDTEDGQNKGVNVSVPAHGLEYLFKSFSVSSVADMLKIIIDRGGKISRCDFCYDDISKTFMPLDYFVWWQNGQFKSKFRVAHFDHGADGGTTFSLGNRAGLRFLRIYDKEIESGGENKSVRYEFEFHSYTADSIARSIVSGSNEFRFIDFLESMFIIIENTGKKQKCRENILGEWENWVLNLKFSEEIVKIPTNLPPKDLEKSIGWFEVYCVKTLAKMFMLFGEDYVKEIAIAAVPKLSESDLEHIINAKEYKYKE